MSEFFETPAKKKTKTKKESPASKLIEALTFISIAQAKIGPPECQFCIFKDGFVYANNGVLTVGYPVEETLNCAAHTTSLLTALKKVDGEFSITEMMGDRLGVVCGSFKAVINCVDIEKLKEITVDANVAIVDDKLKKALGDCVPVTVANAARAIYGCVLLQSNSCVATNGFIMIESWHGIHLPPNVL